MESEYWFKDLAEEIFLVNNILTQRVQKILFVDFIMPFTKGFIFHLNDTNIINVLQETETILPARMMTQNSPELIA